MTSHLKYRLTQLISSGNLEKAIELLLKDHAENSHPLHSEALSISAAFNDLRKIMIAGTILPEQEVVLKNRIASRLLAHIDGLDKETEVTQKTAIVKGRKTSKWVVWIPIIVAIIAGVFGLLREYVVIPAEKYTYRINIQSEVSLSDKVYFILKSSSDSSEEPFLKSTYNESGEPVFISKKSLDKKELFVAFADQKLKKTFVIEKNPVKAEGELISISIIQNEEKTDPITSNGSGKEQEDEVSSVTNKKTEASSEEKEVVYPALEGQVLDEFNKGIAGVKVQTQDGAESMTNDLGLFNLTLSKSEEEYPSKIYIYYSKDSLQNKDLVRVGQKNIVLKFKN